MKPKLHIFSTLVLNNSSAYLVNVIRSSITLHLRFFTLFCSVPGVMLKDFDALLSDKVPDLIDSRQDESISSE